MKETNKKDESKEWRRKPEKKERKKERKKEKDCRTNITECWVLLFQSLSNTSKESESSSYELEICSFRILMFSIYAFLKIMSEHADYFSVIYHIFTELSLAA